MDGSTLTTIAAVAGFVAAVFTFGSVSSHGGEYRNLGSRIVVSLIVGIVMAVFAFLVAFGIAGNTGA